MGFGRFCSFKARRGFTRAALEDGSDCGASTGFDSCWHNALFLSCDVALGKIDVNLALLSATVEFRSRNALA